MTNLSLPFLIIIFLLAGGATWAAGVVLAKTTDTLDTRYKLGDALGGMILLGITGTLPELAVCFTAARAGNVPVIIGNLLGGIAIQTLVIVIFDFAVKKKPLSYLVGSPILVIETLVAVGITALALLGTIIPPTKNLANINPISIVLVIAWVLGLYIINRARLNPKHYESHLEAELGRKHHERRAVENHKFYAGKSNLHVILIFLLGSVATLIAGVYLEISGVQVADRFGISSGIFAATAIALVCALPEISTGLESIIIGDNQLAISDIIGGNIFNLVVFLLADLVAHKPILSFASKADVLLTWLGIIMMSVYGVAFFVKFKKQYFRLGIDSILQILLYAAGVYLLTRI